MALSIPGGAPRYDYDKKLGNNITHCAAQTSQRLRALYRPNPGSQGRDAKIAIWSSVTGFRPFGECEFAVPCHARATRPVPPATPTPPPAPAIRIPAIG